VETAVHARDAVERVGDRPVPTTPGISLPFALVVQRVLRPKRIWYSLAVWLEATPWAYATFTALEKLVKGKLFGCRMCAQCALPSTAYACPMTCPKQLRNGPCGGVAANGDCEVYPGVRCVWSWRTSEPPAPATPPTCGVAAADRQPRVGKSSWVNYWQHRDAGLWTADASFAAAPPIETTLIPLEAGCATRCASIVSPLPPN